MSNYLDRFRYKSGIEKENASRISDVIAESLSKYEVVIERLDKAIPIVFINNDKEGVDEAIIYSYNEDALVVGDYFYFSDYWYLIYKEQKNVKRENYIDSFLAVKCNINFDFNNQNIKGYFRGSMRLHGSILDEAAQNFGLDADNRALVMVPTYYGVGINTEFYLGDQGWRVEMLDKLTTPGVSYLNIALKNLVDTTKVSENEPETPPTPPDEPELDALSSGIIYTFTTEDAYIKSSDPIKIIERKSTSVKFLVPFGTKTITIETKESGEIVSQSYKVD